MVSDDWFFLVWIPAIVISYVTGGQDLAKLNIDLLSPCAQNFMPVKYRHIQLEQENHLENKSEEENKSSFRTKWAFSEGNADVESN